VPVGPGNGIGTACTLFRRPRLDLGHGLPENPALDRLALAVQLLERVGEPPRLGFVLGEEELERLSRVPEPSGRVQARCKAEADGPGVDHGRIDPGAPHERPQTWLRGAREGAQTGDGE